MGSSAWRISWCWCFRGWCDRAITQTDSKLDSVAWHFVGTEPTGASGKSVFLLTSAQAKQQYGLVHPKDTVVILACCPICIGECDTTKKQKYYVLIFQEHIILSFTFT
ncbi:uncharacterized [Tachysurus ichikawai]